MRLVWQFLAVAAVAFIGSQAVAAADGSPWPTLVLGLLTAVLAVPVYRWVVRRTERRQPAELATSGVWGATARGALIGAAVFGAVIASLAFLGDFHIDGRGTVTGAIGLVGFMAAAAVTEELLFRGILFRIAEERLGTWWALTTTGSLFGLMHLTNEHATAWGALAIAIEAGGMLTAAYLATRSLWLPIGLHFGWNFAESGIFSTEVSGNGATHGLLDSSTSGSALVTGGDFGPEASVYSVLFCILVTAAFLRLAHHRGHLQPRRRRAEQTDATDTLVR
ncbi:CPBP family intramembrane metalloprotease [Streptomyces sp. NBC_00378]|uniref:CPBP family intramembrane glutamic endopeptidase n=1 Tax=unclassified Streptomyces TaxID=2593676 RepID=UPI002251AFEF|nr:MULTISPECIES: type II CAAX endopeptidase family protein [unclassified Streptomyces]MCX5112333.1 CPBP family intramembrane metalloprotease [Streptomyces sp. NBC_00378]